MTKAAAQDSGGLTPAARIMNNIAIIHTGAVGDLVQTLPALAAIREAWPAARITFIGRPERARLAALAGVVDDVADIESAGIWRLMSPGVPAALPQALAGAELVVDFLTKGALAAGPARVVSIDPMPPADWADTAAAWIAGQTASRLDVRVASTTPEIPLSDAVVGDARRLLEARGVGRRFVAIHPGSGSTRKNWPAERFLDVAARLRNEHGRTVVWLTGPAEQDRGTLPPDMAPDAVLADLPLDLVTGILALADAYLGNDSGITHVAAAVRRSDGRTTPTVALFGPTSTTVWAPRGRHVRVVCSADGTMDGIAVDDIWPVLSAVL